MSGHLSFVNAGRGSSVLRFVLSHRTFREEALVLYRGRSEPFIAAAVAGSLCLQPHVRIAYAWLRFNGVLEIFTDEGDGWRQRWARFLACLLPLYLPQFAWREGNRVTYERA